MRIACKPISTAATLASTLLLAGLIAPASIAAPPAVWTQHNDNSRTGGNTAETILAPTNVNSTHFGKITSYTLDDQSYSQPLFIPGLQMQVDGQVHNVVFVTTVSNTVDAFDADGLNSAPLWEDHLTPTGSRPPTAQDESNLGACGGDYRDFAGNMGIVGTPVIDTSTKTMYLVARSVDTATSSHFVQQLHALDITSGAEKFGGPVNISATSPDGAQFDSARNNQRMALSLVHGVVYIGWASHCDNGPYHGWLLGYKASTLQKVALWNSTTKANAAGGIWQSGQGVTADSPSGNPNVYVMTGNGTWDGIKNFGESMVKLSTNQSGFVTLSDFFTPSNFDTLNSLDDDLGSSGPLLIPGTPLLFGGGKQGMVYLVDSRNMGHEGSTDAVVQEFQAVNPQISGATGHIHGSPVFLDSTNASGTEAQYIYVWGENDFLHTYKFTPGTSTTTASMTSTSVADSVETAPETNGPGMPGGFLSTSSNAGSNGIVWALTPLDGNANQDTRPGVLYAYDASNFTGTGSTQTLKKLWSSQDNWARDSVGNYAKDTYPTIANGKVYVASWADTSSGSGALEIYGLISNPAPAITSLSPARSVVGGPSFTLTVNGANFVPGATINWLGSPLTTTFISSNQVSATIPASDIQAVGTFGVTVTNPTPGGGTSNAIGEKVVSTSTLTSISPNTAVVGATDPVTLTVLGSGFNGNTRVDWQGTDLATTLVSSTKLTAVIPTSDLTVAGTYTITVTNGAANSGFGSAPFKVTGLATFYGLVTRDFDSSPMAGINIDLVDFQGTHFRASSTTGTSAGVDGNPANFSIPQLGAGTYNLTVTAAPGIALPTVPATVTIPATGGLRQDIAIKPVKVFPAGLQIFSVPDDYGNVDPGVLLAGLNGASVATWDALDFTYALNPTPPANKLSRGRGYWARAGSSGMALYGAHTPAPNTPFVVPLIAGWNMVGVPFDTNIAVSNLRSGSVANPLPAAQLISLSIYGYDAASNSYVASGNTLNEYSGYWVYAIKNGNLIMYP